MDIKTHYEGLELKCKEILSLSLMDERIDKIAKSHSTLFDLNVWLEILKDKPEYNILKTAIKEYQMSILTVNSGLYSQSFIGLRFFLERTLVAIMFSSTELEFRLWEKGERDTYWNEIMNDDKGIFSHKFSRAFFPELKEELMHFKRLTEKVYRECSEFVHGNNSVLTIMPENLEFNENLFNEWHKKALIIKRILLFTLNLRYAKTLKEEDLKSLETINLEEFTQIKAINELY